MKAHLALLLLAVGLCSCARDANSPPAGATGDSSGSPAAPAPAAPAQSGSSSGQVDLATAAKIQEGADTGTTTDSSSAALERIAALPAAGQLPPGPWVAGKNYEVLSP